MSVGAPTAVASRDLPPDPMIPRAFAVVDLRLDTRDTVTLALEPIDGPPLVHRAGQFTMLHAFGVGEVPISICGDPTRPGPLLHTIRDVGARHARARDGDPGHHDRRPRSVRHGLGRR